MKWDFCHSHLESLHDCCVGTIIYERKLRKEKYMGGLVFSNMMFIPHFMNIRVY
jgi:hypothetical protein